MTKKIKEFGADLALVVVAVVWGVTFLPMAEALKSNGVFVILFWRFLISTLLMGLISIKFVKKFDSNSLKFGSLLGVFLFAGFALQTFALKYTFSSTVAFITGLNVVFVPFIVFLFFRQKVYVYSFIGAFLSAFGLYLLSDSELGFGRGEILSLLCAVAYSVHIIFTGVFVRKCELYQMVCMQFLVVTALCLFAALVFDTRSVLPVANYAFFKAVIITSVFATVFAFFVQSAMQRYTTPMKTALIFTFEPVSAGLFGYFVGGEILSSWQILGALLILFGIIISEVGSYYKSQKA